MTTEKKWFDKGEWNEGVVDVHPSVDVATFYNQYQKHPDWWKAAFGYLKNELSGVEPGKYPLIEDKVVAIVAEYGTKKIDDALWESHRKFTDLQYVIKGEEKIGLLPLKSARFASPYQDEKDVILYGEQDGAYYTANSEVCFLFFPEDVHRPCISRTGNPEPVKKLVIKIAFDE
jgi:YhcH/YjgK/YiaL family protein